MSAKLQSSVSEQQLDVAKEDVFSLEGVPHEEHQHQIFDMLMKQDEVSWQTILKDLVKTEQMDPWDIDIKLLCDKFVQTVKSFEKMNFNVSGKMLLASAILLKLKADKLLTSDIHAMDQLIDFVESAEDELGDFDDELERELLRQEYLPKDKKDVLVPRTPQPRKRKVSIFDLVDALEKALEVKQRRPLYQDTYREVEIPAKKIDINELMTSVHKTIMKLIEGRKSLLFHELIPSDSKEDQITTFVPMLHLANQRRLDLEQEKHFGPIEIYLLNKELPDVVAEEEEKQPEALQQLEKQSKKGKKK
jgi:chromatin segregation and condensation protein Rec8/ScpA/Scc1 (kleisin family)